MIRGEWNNSTGLTIHKKSWLSTIAHTCMRAPLKHQPPELCARTHPGVTAFELTVRQRKSLHGKDVACFLAGKFTVDSPRHIARGERRSVSGPLQGVGYEEYLGTRERTTAEQHEAKDDTE